MEITTLTEEEQQAIVSPAAIPGPSKEDILRQLESDYLVAKSNDDSDLMNELDERHSRVLAANDDASALKEYEYRAPVEETEPESEPVSNEF